MFRYTRGDKKTKEKETQKQVKRKQNEIRKYKSKQETNALIKIFEKRRGDESKMKWMKNLNKVFTTTVNVWCEIILNFTSK